MPTKKEQIEPSNGVNCWKRQRGVDIIGSDSSGSSAAKTEPQAKRSPTASASAAAATGAGGVKSLKGERGADSTGPIAVDDRRVRCLTPTTTKPKADGKCVMCLLQRDLRCQDNWALLKAQALALSLQLPLVVAHVIVPKHTFQPTLRHYTFRIGGLAELKADLTDLNIAFVCAAAESGQQQAVHLLREMLQILTPSVAVCDYMPLREPRKLYEDLAKLCVKDAVPLYQVDAHNIIPVWVAADKEQVAARTIRPLLMRQLPVFLTEYPRVRPHAHTLDVEAVCRSPALKLLTPQCFKRVLSVAEAVDALPLCHREVVLPAQWVPGSRRGLELLHAFCSLENLARYEQRNNPLLEAQSNLSPYLHFGQISAQRCLLCVEALFSPGRHPESAAAAPADSGSSQQAAASGNPGKKTLRWGKNKDNVGGSGPQTAVFAVSGGSKNAAARAARESFLNELLTWRELTENFVHFNPHYDSLKGAAGWAQATLAEHSADRREHLYTPEQLEAAQTHDDIWNAAQLQLAEEAKMHGFLRMYWAKKILEWSDTPANALRTAIYLNDKYSLDGTDPNGVGGCMWSICGIHDHGWTERPVFGKIRFMNYSGCCRKFDVPAFLKRYPKAVANAKLAQTKPTKRP